MSINAINVDSAGIELAKPATYAGVYNVNVRQSAATGAGAAVWAIYNPTGSGKTVLIRSAWFQLLFDGTAVATLMKYELVKYTGVTALSGGVAVTPMHKRTSLSGAVVAAARLLDTGLTLTGGTAQAIVQIGTMGRVTQTATNAQSLISQPLGANERGTINAMAIELAAQEALALRQTVVSVIGDNVIGYVETAEY